MKLSDYALRRARIWMIQVRNKGSRGPWSATGARYFNTRKECMDEISTINWPDLEYRATQYLPVDRS